MTEEDCSELNELLNNIPNQFYFLNKLNDWRNIESMMPENVLEFLGGAFSFIISKWEEEKNLEIFRLVTILAGTFYSEKNKEDEKVNVKTFLCQKIENKKIIQSNDVWKQYLQKDIENDLNQKSKEMKKMSNDKKEKIKNDVINAKLLSAVPNMKNCGLEENTIKAIIGDVANNYGWTEDRQNSLNVIIEGLMQEN